MATPLIEAFLRRTQTGVGKINARGAAIGSALQPFAGAVSQHYAPIQSQESSLGSALNQQQASTGQALGAQIGGALTSAQAPAAAVSQYGAGTAQTGAAAGQAIGGLSSADLERLRSTASAEQIYASALPRLAALAADAERRGFLSDAQDDLMELAAQESDRAYARQQDEREFQRQNRLDQRQAQQDRIERGRYRTSLRQDIRKTRYERKQDALERKRQAKLDRLASQAAEQEYGLDIAEFGAERTDEAIRRGISQGNLTERQRHNQQLEAQARARERRQRAKDAKSGKDGKGVGAVGADPLYDNLLRQANSYAGTQSAVLSKNRVNRATARARLWAAYGTALVDKGYSNQAVKKAVERALNASGY